MNHKSANTDVTINQYSKPMCVHTMINGIDLSGHIWIPPANEVVAYMMKWHHFPPKFDSPLSHDGGTEVEKAPINTIHGTDRIICHSMTCCYLTEHELIVSIWNTHVHAKKASLCNGIGNQAFLLPHLLSKTSKRKSTIAEFQATTFVSWPCEEK